jgi:hypothetical protein
MPSNDRYVLGVDAYILGISVCVRFHAITRDSEEGFS